VSRIPDNLVREVLEKTDIVAVIGGYVRLQRSGAQYKGLCPFHAEKTPSFYVTPDKGIFYCFGCQKGGDVITFLREQERLSFSEAVAELAKRAGVLLEVEEAPSEEEQERRALLELYERLAGTFHWFLLKTPAGMPALDRLRSRAISEQIILEFRLGFSPPEHRWLYGFLKSKGYSEAFLSHSGLFSANSPGYPIFSGRLMFPISDAKGRVLAFVGRILEGDGPKYLNSPDTSLFHKQDNLFALDKALPSMRKEGVAIICEGYMDALSFHTAGVTWAVAPLGTAFTAAQAKMLKRWVDRVALCFDSDEAGQKATERACSIAALAGLEPEVVTLPGGKDASEILEKQGPETLQKTQDFTIKGSDFLIRRARELFDIGTIEGKARAASFLYPYADALDMETKRYAFLEFAAREFGANPSSIRTDYETAKRGGSKRLAGSQAQVSTAAITSDLLFLAAVVLDSSRFVELRSSIAQEDIDDTRARDLFIALEESFRADDLSVESILSRVEDETARRFVRECAATGELSVNSELLIADGAKNVRRRSLERRRERLLAKMAAIKAGIGTDSLNDLLYEKMRMDGELETMKGERDE
jgi:DNA primase